MRIRSGSYVPLRPSRTGILFLFLTLFLFLFAAAGTASALDMVDGYYQIGTSQDLADFRDAVNAGSVDIDAKLTADIDLEGANWRPIGTRPSTADYRYNGDFDGAGFRIANFVVTAQDVVTYYNGYVTRYAAGLFGVLSGGATVSRLRVEECSIDTGSSSGVYGGALAGVNVGGRIEEVHVHAASADIVANIYAGGVVGYNNNGTVTNSTASGIGSITANSYAGGVVGYNNNGTVTNSTASGIGSITASSYAGGVVGLNDGGIVTNSTASGIGSITADNDYAGGVVGRNNGGTVTNSTASGIGSITADSGAGGVVGGNTGGTVTNSTASGIGSITTPGAMMSGAGGVVGLNDGGIVTNSTASGIERITGSCAGGVAGQNYGTVTNCLLLWQEGDEPTAISGGTGETGGVLGYTSPNNPPDFTKVNHCLYPSDTEFSGNDWRAIGNYDTSPDIAGHRVMSYDAALSPDMLPAVVAVIERGMTHTMFVGGTLKLDVTTLPGTLVSGSLTFTWSSPSADIVSVSPASGAAVTLEAHALGTADVTCTVTGDISADLTCTVTVIDGEEPAFTVSGPPADGVIYLDDPVEREYDFFPFDAIDVDPSGLLGSGLTAEIVGVKVVLRDTGEEKTPGAHTFDVLLRSADGWSVWKTITVTVEDANRYTSGGGSSNCNAFGFGFAVLAALPFLYRRKR